MRLILMTEERVLAKTTLWLRRAVGEHRVLAIPRLRLEQRTAMILAEGSSLLYAFQDAECLIEGKSTPARVLGGTPQLFKSGAPVLTDAIFFLPGQGPAPRLSTLISVGVRMLRE
jgi:hypothetical protein